MYTFDNFPQILTILEFSWVCGWLKLKKKKWEKLPAELGLSLLLKAFVKSLFYLFSEITGSLWKRQSPAFFSQNENCGMLKLQSCRRINLFQETHEGRPQFGHKKHNLHKKQSCLHDLQQEVPSGAPRTLAIARSPSEAQVQ